MDVLPHVEAHLLARLGEASGRASVTFVGAEPLDVLRLGPDADRVVRYVTLGMSRHPMTDPGELAPDPVRGPRAELVLSLRARPDVPTDTVLRVLAALSMAPFVEGLVTVPGASLDVGEPLWDGAPFTAVLVAEPGGLVPDLALGGPADPVRFLPVLPMTPTESGWKRVHGAVALEELWLRHGTDLRDPLRRAVPLGGQPPDVRSGS